MTRITDPIVISKFQKLVNSLQSLQEALDSLAMQHLSSLNARLNPPANLTHSVSNNINNIITAKVNLTSIKRPYILTTSQWSLANTTALFSQHIIA